MLRLLDLKTFDDSKIEKAKEAFSRRGLLHRSFFFAL